MIYSFLNFCLSLSLLLIPVTVTILIFRKFKNELIASKFYFGGLVLLNIVFLNKLLFGGQTLTAQDFNNIQITFNHFFQNSFREFLTPPIWYSKIGGGFDAFSNPVSNYFSPFNLLLLIIPEVYFATNLIILFTLIFISISSFLLFRELKLSKNLSFLGAVIFTFNAFVIMRLSPGVGIEYLYTFKWIPFVILFAYKIFVNKEKNFLLFLAVALSFTFEGNFNIAFGVWCFWFLFLVVFYGKKILSIWKEFLGVLFFAFAFYSIKLLPGIDLMLSSSGRISSTVSGWRTSRMKLYEFLEYFLPISHKFQSPNFTFGVIALILFLVGFGYFWFKFYKNRSVDFLFKFSIISFLIGCFLNTDNPGSELFFTFPIFNRITVTPTYLIFLMFPMILWILEGANLISKKFKFAPLVFGILIFVEVLFGFSTFGTRTFSFNFPKMNISEAYQIPHYEAQKKYSGVFFFNSNNNTFMYPYGIELSGVKVLNPFKYFYSYSNTDEMENNISDQIFYSDYIYSLNSLSNPNLNLKETVKVKSLLSKFQSFAIFERSGEFNELSQTQNWDKNLNIYEVSSNIPSSSKNLSNNPFEFTLQFTDKNLTQGDKLSTSVTYSKWWRVSSDYDSNKYGLVEIKNTNLKEVKFIYFNYFIYLGMLLTICSFVLFLYYEKLITKNN